MTECQDLAGYAAPLGFSTRSIGRPESRVSEALAAYLDHEARMLEAERKGAPALADALRDVMDGLWWALSDADREVLRVRCQAQDP